MSRFKDEAQGMPSQRQLRVGELLRKELSEILSRGDVRDPVLETHIVIVPEVRVSPDFKHATVLIMPLGGMDAEAVVEALGRHRKYLRGQVARRMTMKFMPDLHFRLDTRFDDDDRITQLLRKPEVARDLDDEGDDEE
ncbi:30S ribosome-binding factor RbfA [Breoghania sp.]|uniref:30S ribosome-binding factor RbfA n=1 Tax=Breoghania sp. TaxID=2065378 RepID=UPI0026079A67|nr:30S ribosome-binding factor RbfA [Breoghania sp.]MDJ0930866.1 30S ribosome-binding factor RbfA [Breoghania sp.]